MERAVLRAATTGNIVKMRPESIKFFTHKRDTDQRGREANGLSLTPQTQKAIRFKAMIALEGVPSRSLCG